MGSVVQRARQPEMQPCALQFRSVDTGCIKRAQDNGDKVVALLPDGSTTLKTFFKEDDHIRLQPANPDFDAIRVKFCTIQGIGELRTLIERES